MVRDIVVSIDLDATLLTDKRLERSVALAALDELAARQQARFDRAAAELAIDEFLASARESDRETDEFIAAFYARFVTGAAEAADAARHYRARAVAQVPNFVEALPGARDLLAGLDRSAIPYAVLTNGWSPLQEAKARFIDVRAPVLVSECIGARKPSRSAFSALREYFDVPFERIWHIGDDARADCAGAKNVGMTAVWFDAKGDAYPGDVAPADYVVHSHAQLLALLCAT